MRARLALLIAAACLTACGDASYRGSWEVVGYRRPAVSILGDLEAQTMLGSTLEITRATATVGPDSCAIAEAQRQTLAVRDLEMAYDLARGELGLADEMVEMMELQCSEGQLEFGEQLIRVAPDTLLAPWGGIFLLLEKRRS